MSESASLAGIAICGTRSTCSNGKSAEAEEATTRAIIRSPFANSTLIPFSFSTTCAAVRILP